MRGPNLNQPTSEKAVDAAQKDDSAEAPTLKTLKHQRDLKIEKLPSGVAILWFDCAGKVNVLGNSAMVELRELIQAIKADQEIKALVIASKKPDTFVSGADLHEIMGFESTEQAHQLSLDGQYVFNQLENLGKPTVAAINGPCLGGGLEVALCTNYRIATDSPHTVLGLPEVRLGLIPGLGGTQRLPRLIPVKVALEYILNSDIVSAERALELGILDKVVDGKSLHEEAEAAALAILKGEMPARALTVEDPEKLKKLFATMTRSIKIRLKGNYPAPIKAIEAVQLSTSAPLAEGLAFEARAFADLASDKTSSNLIQLFFSQDFTIRSAARTAEKIAGKELKTLGIIGSGIMGMDIAKIASAHGINVIVKTSSENRAQEMTESHRAFEEHLRRAPSDKPDYAEIKFSHELSILSPCDMVIEAVPEDSKLKQRLLAEVENIVADDCVLVTNTSALELIELGQELKKPERFVGLHFFYPVGKMPLVEVISHPSTNAATNARALALLTRLGKVPISVKDSVGFLVNRLLTTHLMEASRMLDEGFAFNWIEDAALQFGLPMGPFTLVDELGLPLCISVANKLHAAFGDRFTPPEVMKTTSAAGFKGKISGAGCYHWDESGEKLEINPEFSAVSKMKISDEKASSDQMAEIQNRLILVIVDEAARCLEEKVVRKPRELDLALVVGSGFPPFRGGVLRYADSFGIARIVDTLNKIYATTEPKREISNLLTSMSETGRRFYSSGAD